MSNGYQFELKASKSEFYTSYAEEIKIHPHHVQELFLIISCKFTRGAYESAQAS